MLKKLFNLGGNSKFDNLTVKDYQTDFIDSNTPHTFIDVRTKQEYKSGHADKAKNIPLSDIQNRLKDIPKNKPVVVICASGNRSRSACQKLADAGYETIYNIKGGTMAWRMNGMKMKG